MGIGYQGGLRWNKKQSCIISVGGNYGNLYHCNNNGSITNVANVINRNGVNYVMSDCPELQLNTSMPWMMRNPRITQVPIYNQVINYGNWEGFQPC